MEEQRFSTRRFIDIFLLAGVLLFGLAAGFSVRHIWAANEIAELKTSAEQEEAAAAIRKEFLLSGVFSDWYAQVEGVVAGVDVQGGRITLKDEDSGAAVTINIKQGTSVVKSSADRSDLVQNLSVNDIAAGSRVAAYVRFIGGVPYATNIFVVSQPVQQP